MRRLPVLLLIAILAGCAAPAFACAAPASSRRAQERMVQRQAHKAFAEFRHPERKNDVPRLAGDDAVLNPILRRASTRRIAHGNGFDGYLALNARGLGAVCLLLITPADTGINHVCGENVPSFLRSYPVRTAKLPDGRVAVVMPMADGAPPALQLTSPDQRLMAPLAIRGNALAEVVPEHQLIALLPTDGTRSIVLVEANVPASRSQRWIFVP
jgi:hypothetical protein